MTRRKSGEGLDFGALRLGIERCDPDLLFGFYADDARLNIVNAAAPQASPFELRGKAEIAKHLRAVFGQGASHRVEREEVTSVEDGVRFREVCVYPDGSRVVVETTLEVREGKISRRVDAVAMDASADGEDMVGRSRTTVLRTPDKKPKRRNTDDVASIERGEAAPSPLCATRGSHTAADRYVRRPTAEGVDDGDDTDEGRDRTGQEGT